MANRAPQFPMHVEYPLQAGAPTTVTSPEPSVTPVGSPAQASASNWFGRQSPKGQTLISAALALPAVILPSSALLPPAPTFLVSVVFFIVVLAVVSRSHRRRTVAIVMAGITGAVALMTALLLFYATPQEQDSTLRMLVFWPLLLFPLGFVAAWSIARRNRPGRWIGLVLAAPAVLLSGPFLVGPLFGIANGTPSVRPFEWFVAWGGPTALGCAVAWGVDLAARRNRKNPPRHGSNAAESGGQLQ